jgi:hypothetical protein
LTLIPSSMIHRRESRTKMFHYPKAAGWKILSMTSLLHELSDPPNPNYKL